MDLKAYLRDRRELIDSFIRDHLGSPLHPKPLHESMFYSLTAGGKRIRPILCIAAYEACGGKAEDIIPYASALEFIHTYSLIHDDLPAMDNDDLRRGKPTNHKVFGEGMAILAGDGLLTEAFSILSDINLVSKGDYQPSSHALIRIIHEVSRAAGIYGMVAGQAQDLLSEESEPDEETLLFIHTHKTAAMLNVSVRIGAILAEANEETLLLLTRYGTSIGLAFQIIDDIIDITESTETLGKTSGSDDRKGKMTYPRLYGLERSRTKAEALIERALESLEGFDERAEPLRRIALYLSRRRS